MALTMKEYIGDGSTTVYDITFPSGYLQKEDVYVYLKTSDINEQLSYTWLNPNQIELTEPVDVGVIFYIRRIVDRRTLINDYQDGAILRECELNTSFLQTLMVAQELSDGFMSIGEFQLWSGLNMNFSEIRNLAVSSSRDSAMPRHEVDSLIDQKLAFIGGGGDGTAINEIDLGFVTDPHNPDDT